MLEFQRNIFNFVFEISESLPVNTCKEYSGKIKNTRRSSKVNKEYFYIVVVLFLVYKHGTQQTYYL